MSRILLCQHVLFDLLSCVVGFSKCMDHMEAINQHQLTPVSSELHLHGLPHVTVFPLHSQKHGFVAALPCSWFRALSPLRYGCRWESQASRTRCQAFMAPMWLWFRIQVACGSPSATGVCERDVIYVDCLPFGVFGGGIFPFQRCIINCWVSVSSFFFFFSFFKPHPTTFHLHLPLSKCESATCTPKLSTPLRTCSWMAKTHVSCFSPGVACDSHATFFSESVQRDTNCWPLIPACCPQHHTL